MMAHRKAAIVRGVMDNWRSGPFFFFFFFVIDSDKGSRTREGGGGSGTIKRTPSLNIGKDKGTTE